MDEKRTTWPMIVGITAGVLGALAAVTIMYAVKEEEPEVRIRDAKDIIAQCHDQIREIEARLNILRESAA